MGKIIEGTPVYLWYNLILDGQDLLNINLSEELKIYLVFLLIENMHNHRLSSAVLSISYLEAASNSSLDKSALKVVADDCLLLAGLWPENSLRRNVSVDYFSMLGASSYMQLSEFSCRSKDGMGNLYKELALNLDDAIMILFFMHCIGDLKLDFTKLEFLKYGENKPYKKVLYALEARRL